MFRVCHTSSRVFTQLARSFAATSDVPAVTNTLNEDLSNGFFARDSAKAQLDKVDKFLVDNKAVKDISFGDFVRPMYAPHPDFPALVNEQAQQLAEVTNKLDSLVDSMLNSDPSADVARGFEFRTFRKGDEDSLLNSQPDWEFLARVHGADVTRVLYNAYEQAKDQIQEEIDDESFIKDHLPLLLQVNNKVTEEANKIFDNMRAEFPKAVEDFKSLPETLEIIENWDLNEMWFSAPRLAAAVQRDIDNSNWDFIMEDDAHH